MTTKGTVCSLPSKVNLSRYQNFKRQYTTSIKKTILDTSFDTIENREKNNPRHTKCDLFLAFFKICTQVLVQKKTLNTHQRFCNNVNICAASSGKSDSSLCFLIALILQSNADIALF